MSFVSVYQFCFFFFNDTATTEIYTLSLHDALPILSSSDVEEIVLVRTHRVAETDRPIVQLDAAPGSAPLEHGHVAAVGVDVEVVRIQMTENELQAASQYGLTSPRSDAIRRRASMAVYVGRTLNSAP